MNASPRTAKLIRLLSLLLLTALLSSCGLPLLTETEADGMTYSLRGNGRVEQIEVRKENKTVGTYKQKGLKQEILAQIGVADYGFRLTDLNFDGQADMQLMIAKAEGAQRYASYLWDDRKGEYVYHAKLSALQDIGMIASLQVITAREHSYVIDPATGDSPEFYTETDCFSLYRWIDGQLTEVHRKEKTYYEESDIYCYAVYELDENGKLDLIRESWIDAEKINHDKYPMDATGFEGYVPQAGNNGIE